MALHLLQFQPLLLLQLLQHLQLLLHPLLLLLLQLLSYLQLLLHLQQLWRRLLELRLWQSQLQIWQCSPNKGIIQFCCQANFNGMAQMQENICL